MEESSSDSPQSAQKASYERAKLPPEIIHSIIYQFDAEMYSERRALSRISLASKQTLHATRILLSTVVFRNGYNNSLERFLGLLDTSWTSLTSIRKICIHFPSYWVSPAEWDARRDMERILSNLKNVESLWLTSIQWDDYTPYPIVRLVGGLRIRDIRFEAPSFRSSKKMTKLLELLPQTIEAVTIYNAEPVGLVAKDYNIIDRPLTRNTASVYERRWHFQILDTTSIITFRKMWEPFLLPNLNINLTVETLYIPLVFLSGPRYRKDLPFISDFVKLVAPSVKAISLGTGDEIYNPEFFLAMESLDFRQAKNIDRIHIPVPQFQWLDEIIPCTNFIWKSLASIVSNNSPRQLIFTTIDSFADAWFGEKDTISQIVAHWADIVISIHKRYPSFEKIMLRVGDRYDDLPRHQYIEELRKTGLKTLEATGLFRFRHYMWQHPAIFPITDGPLDWKDSFTMDNIVPL